MSAAPPLPTCKLGPRGRQKKAGVKVKLEAVRELSRRLRDMKAANKSDAFAHPQEELDELSRKLVETRSALACAQRRAAGVPQAIREQRAKVRALKAANKVAPETHSKEEIALEMSILRALMSKGSKKKPVPPAKPQELARDENAGIAAQEARSNCRAAPPTQPGWRDGWRRCNCARNAQGHCSCLMMMPIPAEWMYPPPLPTLAQIRMSQARATDAPEEARGGGRRQPLTGVKLLAAKGLDVVKLKREVEMRGGFDKVEARREWRQIARAMHLPPNTCADHLRRQFVAAATAPTTLRFPLPQQPDAAAGVEARTSSAPCANAVAGVGAAAAGAAACAKGEGRVGGKDGGWVGREGACGASGLQDETPTPRVPVHLPAEPPAWTVAGQFAAWDGAYEYGMALAALHHVPPRPPDTADDYERGTGCKKRKTQHTPLAHAVDAALHAPHAHHKHTTHQVHHAYPAHHAHEWYSAPAAAPVHATAASQHAIARGAPHASMITGNTNHASQDAAPEEPQVVSEEAQGVGVEDHENLCESAAVVGALDSAHVHLPLHHPVTLPEPAAPPELVDLPPEEQLHQDDDDAHQLQFHAHSPQPHPSSPIITPLHAHSLVQMGAPPPAPPPLGVLDGLTDLPAEHDPP